MTPTSTVYEQLLLVEPSRLELAGRSFEDQALQAALAVLALRDEHLDGLWWSDTLAGAMRTGRGGLFQHRLCALEVTKAAASPAGTLGQVQWQPSAIL
jgi:hypothetical protein